MDELSRRKVLGLMAGGAVAASLPGCAFTGRNNGKDHSAMVHENAHYYGPDGAFQADRAKQAYYAMMDRFRYHIPERLRGDDFWTLDFGLGKFTEVGMAGIFWVNNQEHNYMGHEIYLLPGQMIPEHWHLPTAAGGAKMEAWHCRHGQVTLFGEGEPTPGVEELIPPTHKAIAKARQVQVIKPGEYGWLKEPKQRHFMVAGPEGAIVSEYATFHDMDGLRFTHPDIKL